MCLGIVISVSMIKVTRYEAERLHSYFQVVTVIWVTLSFLGLWNLKLSHLPLCRRQGLRSWPQICLYYSALIPTRLSGVESESHLCAPRLLPMTSSRLFRCVLVTINYIWQGIDLISDTIQEHWNKAKRQQGKCPWEAQWGLHMLRTSSINPCPCIHPCSKTSALLCSAHDALANKPVQIGFFFFRTTQSTVVPFRASPLTKSYMDIKL